MNKILTNYNEILKQIDFYKNKHKSKYINPELIAVSKKFPKEKIQILIDAGHKVFGENKVQEAHLKWVELKNENKTQNLKLHLIGPLQSNKVFQALEIFDVIQTLDREKIALKAKNYFDEKKKSRDKVFFVQVNIGREPQKSGVDIDHAKQFVEWCSMDLNLKISGLMCIPPLGTPSQTFFKKLRGLCDELNLLHASMGMTSDFGSAIENGATFIRVGTGIFGSRD